MNMDEYIKYMNQQLHSTSLTQHTMVAGCLIWGYSAASEVVSRVSDEAMIQLATTSVVVKFKANLPSKEVTKEQMNRYLVTGQVSSWDRKADIKYQTELLMEEARRYTWILEQLRKSFS